jgi:hypothetical protein
MRPGHRDDYPAAFPVSRRLTSAAVNVAVRQSVRAADLLALERCTAPCLLAAEDGECACRCGGEFHGALTEADVTIGPAGWPAPAALRPEGYVPDDAVPRRELRALPFGAPASVLRLQAAMLAWDCGAREAARRLGMDRSTMYKAIASRES